MTLISQKARLLIFLIVAFNLIVPYAPGQQSQEPKSFRLERLEFEGLKRFGREQVVEASGLKIGQMVNEPVLDQAANRLVQSGFFTNVSYRLRAGGGQATVTFSVEEKTEKGLPVVFDNFVWFSDQELATVIRREIPSFDGSLPDAGNATDSVKAILQRLLAEKKIPGTVEYLMSADPTGAEAAFVYSIKGASIPICELAFTGASAIKDDELKENSKPIFNDDYSRGIVVGFANATLGDLYRERGYLRARFPDASVKPRDNVGCKNGVAVTLFVEEGFEYMWDRAEWIDNKAFSAPELDAALGMKRGEVASITKINKGLFQVKTVFGTKGYITASLRPTRDFDDEKRSVTFRLKVIEGAQFKMGTLSFSGIPDDMAARLKSQWKIMPGEVYNASYLNEFVRTVVDKDESLARLSVGRRIRIDTNQKPDRQNSTVSVAIAMKQEK